MYDAPQCKVLIAGQSYMKCMELKRMLNWAEEGFRVILEQNICSCETPLERVNPDILILVGITGWMDVKVIIDSFAKKHNLSQIIVVCDEKNPLGLSNQIRFLPSAVTPELLRSALRAIKEALTAAVPGDFSSGQVGQARDLLLQYAARVPSSRLVIARLCLEQPCQTPAASLRLEEAFRRYLNPEAFFDQESVFSYCFLLGLSAVSIRDQLQLIEYALRSSAVKPARCSTAAPRSFSATLPIRPVLSPNTRRSSLSSRSAFSAMTGRSSPVPSVSRAMPRCRIMLRSARCKWS